MNHQEILLKYTFLGLSLRFSFSSSSEKKKIPFLTSFPGDSEAGSSLKQKTTFGEMRPQTSTTNQNLPFSKHLSSPGCARKVEGTQNVLQEPQVGVIMALPSIYV